MLYTGLPDGPREIKGNYFGIRLQPRGVEDPHVCLQLLLQDDMGWHEVGNPFSSHWLNDLMSVLHATIVWLRKYPRDKGYGRKFPTSEDSPQRLVDLAAVREMYRLPSDAICDNCFRVQDCEHAGDGTTLGIRPRTCAPIGTRRRPGNEGHAIHARWMDIG